jgi:DNA-binding CsgD family transcriptional regulator
MSSPPSNRFERRAKRDAGDGRQTRLSPRQTEVLALLGSGLTQREVGAQLHLTTETIRTHVRAARRALGARTVAHAVALALDEEALVVERRVVVPALPRDAVS